MKKVSVKIFIVITSLILISNHTTHSHNDVSAHKCEVKNEMRNPIAYSFLRNLAKAYLEYNLGKVFNYIENRILEYIQNRSSSHVKEHITRVWSTYDELKAEYSPRKHSSFDKHYNECHICSGIGELLTKKEFENNLRAVEEEMSRINKVTNQRITQLEQKLEHELKEIDRRFISLEQTVRSLEEKIMINEHILDEHEERIEKIQADIARYSKPRILVFTSRAGRFSNEYKISSLVRKYEAVK